MMAFNSIVAWWYNCKAIAVAAAENGKNAGGAPGGDGNAPQMTDINDIKPLLAIGPDWHWLFYLAAGIILVLVLVALGWWLWKRRKQTEPSMAPAPPITPDAEAYLALDELAAENGLRPKHFYFRLSAILRFYIERRFNLPAAEMTTEELLPQLNRLPLESSLAMQFRSFCCETDPVKFAGAPVRQEKLAHDLAFSRDFVRQTTTVAPKAESTEPPEPQKYKLEQ